MKIKRIEIYGYGKWIDQSFDLNEDLQVFYGPNEAGKSTLQSFIKSILFGFPDRRRRVNKLNRYVPRQSDTYGGRVLLTDTVLGDVWVERKDKNLTITNSSGEVLDEGVLNEILGGLSEDLFDTYYSFNLENFQELSNIGKDSLNEHFLSIGTAGSDLYLKLINQLEKNADELYRPKARKPILNQALTSYKENCEKLQSFEESLSVYDDVVSQETQVKAKIDDLNEQIDQLDKDLQKQKSLIERYDIYQKSQFIKEELKNLNYTNIPQNHPQKLKEYLSTASKLESEITQTEERVRNLKNQLNQLDDYHWAKNHQQERKVWLQSLNNVKDLQNQYENLQARIQEAEDDLTNLAHRGKFYPDKLKDQEYYKSQVQKGLQLEGDRQEITEKINQAQTSQDLYTKERNSQQNSLITIRQNLVNLKNQQLIEQDQLHQSTSPKEYLIPLIAFLSGLGLILLNFITKDESSVYLYSGIFVLVLGLVSGVYIYTKHQKLKNAYQSNPIQSRINSLSDQEENIRNSIQKLNSQIQKNEDQITNLENSLATIISKQSNWVEDLGFYPEVDANWILQTDPISHYQDAKARKENYQNQLAQIDLEIIKWRESLGTVLKDYPPASHQTRQVIRHIENLEVQFSEVERLGDQLQEQIQTDLILLEEKKKSLSDNKNQAQAILKQAECSNEHQFDEKLAINQKIDQLQQEYDLLSEQISDYIPSMEKITGKTELELSLNSGNEKRHNLREQVNALQSQRADLTHQINKIEADGSYEDLTQALELEKEDLVKLINQWASDKIAAALLTQTLSQGLKNPVPLMNELATKIFKTLSGDRYTEININKDHIKVKQYTDVLFELHELSQGTLEQLYVSLRLAFIICAKDQVKMPIIIDDAFVNFDEVRKERMYQVLDQIKDQNQILFFTFDQQAKDRWLDENLIELFVKEEIPQEKTT